MRIPFLRPMKAFTIALSVVLHFADLSVAEVHLHSDLSGVTTQVGNVVLSTRPGGRVTSSVIVGDNIFHTSNFGFQGVSRHGTTGRWDYFTRRGSQSRSLSRLSPYRLWPVSPHVHSNQNRQWKQNHQFSALPGERRYWPIGIGAANRFRRY